jgi:RNA polymerase sigma factor (sigma-70 family)
MNPFHKYSDTKLLSFWDKESDFRMGRESEENLVFSEIYDRNCTKVYSFCLRKLNDNSDKASDILQDTFIVLYKNLKKGCCIHSLVSYLFGTARNLCLNYLNREQYRTISLDDEGAYLNIENYFEDMINKIESDDLFEFVLKAVNTLSDDLREVYELREFSGMKYCEIADICQIPVSTAKDRVYRAQENIRKFLSPYIDDLKK